MDGIDEIETARTSPTIIIIPHRDTERFGRLKIEFLIAAVEESGGGGGDGLEG